MNNVKVSVIMPVHNAAKYLHTCMNSLVNQTLKDIEIICINDDSTDNSLEIQMMGLTMIILKNCILLLSIHLLILRQHRL